MDGNAILEAVRELAPTLCDRVNEIEAGRRMPDDVVEMLAGAGVFRMAMPKAWRGPEADLWTQFQIVEALATVDGSLGWYAMIGSDGGFYSAFLDDATGRELWPDIDAITAGFITPAGSAVVDHDSGGYRVSGRWAFGSAGIHSRLLASGCIVVDGENFVMTESGMPQLLVALLPTDVCEFHDTWHTTGLRGTSSNDYSAADVHVPENHTFPLLTGTPQRAGTIYGAGNLFLSNMAGVPLGLAAHAIEALKAVALTKRSPTGVPLHEDTKVLTAIAHGEVSVAAARALVRETFGDISDTLAAGDALSERQRAMFRGVLVHAADVGREVALAAFRCAGGSAVYEKNPFDRIVRDALTAGQHIALSATVNEDCGRLFLGLPPQAPLI